MLRAAASGGRPGSSTLKRFLQIAVMLAIGGVALWATFRGVEWDEFAAELSRVDWFAFGLGVAAFATVHVIRSFRWGLLVQGVAPHVSFRSYLSICSIGFFLINILPFRLGEFVRPYLLYEREEVPFGSGLATVVVERVLDVAALGVIFLSVLAFADLPSTTVVAGGEEVDVVALGRLTILGTLLPVIVVLAVMILLGDRGVELTRRLSSPLGPRLSGLAARFVETFVGALKSLGTIGRASKIIGWTAFTWTLNIVSMIGMAKGFDFAANMGFWDGATILVCICIFLILPAPPGFAGVFEFSIFLALTWMGVGEAAAAAFGVMVHAGQFVLLTAFGVFFLAVDRISVGRLLSDMAKLRQGEPDESG